MDLGFVSGLARQDSPLLTRVAKDVYPSLLGSHQYAAVCTRPDVSTSLSILGYASANHTEGHRQALMKVVRYLKGTIQMRMTSGGEPYQSLKLTGFADADWANDNITRKFRSGYLFTLGRGHVS
jgi:hypothetical protein